MKFSPFPGRKLALVLLIVPIALAGCGGGGGDSSPKVSAAKSTITAAPTTVTANGKAVANITVSLKDSKGNAYTGSTDVNIEADPCSNCTLHYANKDGKVTGTIKSTAAQDITLSFTVNGTASPSTALVHFVAGPPDAEQSRISVVNPDVAAWADGYSSKQVVVTLYDRFGNRITSGDYRNDIKFFSKPLPPLPDGMGAFTKGASSLPTWACFIPGVGLACLFDYIESAPQALSDGQYGASVTTIGNGTEAIYAVAATARPSRAPLPRYESATIGFSVEGVRSPNTVEGWFDDTVHWIRTCGGYCSCPGGCGLGRAFPAASTSAAVSAPAPLSVMQAWTVETCTQQGACTDHGVYETDPSVPATLAVPGDLMVPAGGHPVIAVERTAFDPADGVLIQLGAGAAIYAQDGKLWRLDLAHGVSAPTQLSTLEFTALCSLTPISPYNVIFGDNESVGAPTGLIVAGFDAQGKTAADCASEPAKRWLVFSNGGANPPIALDADQHYLMSLADPKSGAALGLLFQDGTDLVIYRPNFTASAVLAKDLVPAGSRAVALNYRGMHKAAVIDVPAIGNGRRTDTFYRVGADALGTIKLASLSAYTSDDYFSYCVNGAADFQPSGVVGTHGFVYFAYPSSSGFTVYRLGPLSGTRTAIYKESGAWCNEPGVWATKSGYYALMESNPSSGDSRLISVSQRRLAGQQPEVLASVTKPGSLLTPYYSVGADTFWIEKGECGNAQCTQHSVSVTAAKADGSASQVFNGALLAGDAQQGITAVSGNVLRAYVGLVQTPNRLCSPTAWALYDPKTLAPVYQPNFGAGACPNQTSPIYGPNETLLTGNVPDTSGGGTSVYSLYYPLGAQYVPPVTPVLKKLAHYALPPGAASIEVVPIF